MDVEIEWTPKARAVLAAASDLFYERGIHAVGVELIAERARVTKKTLYDRFGSKERLVVAYLTERDRRWRGVLDEHLAAAGADPAARLDAVFDASAAWSRVHGAKGCSMINAHAEISDPAHPAYAVIVGQKRWMRELFADLVRDVGVDDVDRVADELMLVHEGALVTRGMEWDDRAFARARAMAGRLLG